MQTTISPQKALGKKNDIKRLPLLYGANLIEGG
jgi:hypothetical protein